MYIAITLFQSYRNIEAGDTQSLKSLLYLGSNSRPNVMQAKGLTTAPYEGSYALIPTKFSVLARTCA